MGGSDTQQETPFSYLLPESRTPKSHPLLPIREMVTTTLAELAPDFEAIYTDESRPSITPEKLLRASLLQILYSIRSERLLCEQLDYNLLFRWFVGLSMAAPVWDHSTFTKNRDRLLESDIARGFFEAIVTRAREEGLTSDEHFSVDGTLIEAWASMKSVRRQDRSDGPPGGGRNPERSFHGEERKNETDESATDPQAKLFRKGQGKEARLCYMGHALMDNRHGLVMDAPVTEATGTAERDTAVEMVGDRPGKHRITVAADKLYGTRAFVDRLRELNATPHVAQNDTNRRSTIDGRTISRAGYKVSQHICKWTEKAFRWSKQIGSLRQTKYRGNERVNFHMLLMMADYNLVRMRNLLAGRRRPDSTSVCVFCLMAENDL